MPTLPSWDRDDPSQGQAQSTTSDRHFSGRIWANWRPTSGIDGSDSWAQPGRQLRPGRRGFSPDLFSHRLQILRSAFQASTGKQPAGLGVLLVRKNSLLECKEADVTVRRPLWVTQTFVNLKSASCRKHDFSLDHSDISSHYPGSRNLNRDYSWKLRL